MVLCTLHRLVLFWIIFNYIEQYWLAILAIQLIDNSIDRIYDEYVLLFSVWNLILALHGILRDTISLFNETTRKHGVVYVQQRNIRKTNNDEIIWDNEEILFVIMFSASVFKFPWFLHGYSCSSHGSSSCILFLHFFTFFSPFFLFRRVARTFLLVVYLIVAGTFVIS